MHSFTILTPPNFSSSLSFPIRLPSVLLSPLSLILMSPLLSILHRQNVRVSLPLCGTGERVGMVIVSTELHPYNPLNPSIASEIGCTHISSSHIHSLFLILFSFAKPQSLKERGGEWYAWCTFFNVPSQLFFPSGALHFSLVWTDIHFTVLSDSQHQNLGSSNHYSCGFKHLLVPFCTHYDLIKYN